MAWDISATNVLGAAPSDGPRAVPPTTRGPSLIVFDLDGTLVDSSRDIAAAVERALRRLAPECPAPPCEVVRGFIGEGAGRLVERVLEYTGLQALGVERTLAAFLESYRLGLLDHTRLYPGVGEMLAALGPAWAPKSGPAPVLAVLTNKPGDLSRAILAGLGVAGAFARVLGGGDGPARKPDPQGLWALMAAYGVAPRRTALVGDSAIDVATGRAAGVRTVGVVYGLDPEGLKAARPDCLLDDLRALPDDLLRAGVLG